MARKTFANPRIPNTVHCRGVKENNVESHEEAAGEMDLLTGDVGFALSPFTSDDIGIITPGSPMIKTGEATLFFVWTDIRV